MNKNLHLDYIKLGIPLLLISFLAILPATEIFKTTPKELSIGILLDLLITIPIVYFLIIRKTKIPNFTVLYAYILGILLASLFIPSEHQGLLATIKSISIPVIEIGIITIIIAKIISLNRAFKGTKGKDFYDRVLLACEEIFPNRIGKVLATEIAVIYYLFSTKTQRHEADINFTYYKKSGIQTTIMVLLFMVLLETIVVHYVLAKWNANIAWILTFLSLYTMFQISAVLKSMARRPITIDYESNHLLLRYGFGCQTSIPFDALESIEPNRRLTTNDKSHQCLSLFDMLDTNNTKIILNTENTLLKLYGIKKKYRSISLFVDERDIFIENVKQIITDRKDKNESQSSGLN